MNPKQLAKAIYDHCANKDEELDSLDLDAIESIIRKHMGKCEHDVLDVWDNGLASHTKKAFPTCPFCPKKEEPMSKDSGKEWWCKHITWNKEYNKWSVLNYEIGIEGCFKWEHWLFCPVCGTPRPAQQEKKQRLIDPVFAQSLIADCEKILETLKVENA